MRVRGRFERVQKSFGRKSDREEQRPDRGAGTGSRSSDRIEEQRPDRGAATGSRSSDRIEEQRPDQGAATRSRSSDQIKDLLRREQRLSIRVGTFTDQCTGRTRTSPDHICVNLQTSNQVKLWACGHRFVKTYGPFKERQMIGRCYLHGINESEMQFVYQPCDHRNNFIREAMCNAGISAFITQDQIVVGSPGSFMWQGNVHAFWRNPDDEWEMWERDLSDLEQRHIYIGYSVTQARLVLSKDEETIVTGAPRDGKEDARGSVWLLVKQSRKLVKRQVLHGQQTGSYFGNAVTITDLNRDGWNDLLVGAPFYFNRQKGEGGAVYIYMNTGGRFETTPTTVLTGPPGSAFGIAVAAAGDLNQDGFQDVAVGAPFHESGSVMIWTGSEDGVRPEPSQVIHGSSVSSRFRTFGYSLSAGLDVDENQYPDLLVGSLDDTVVLLRTRPIIQLNTTLQISPDVIDPNNCNFCIQVQMCSFYSLNDGGRGDDGIKIFFTLTADVTSLKPRLLFQSNGQTAFSGSFTPRQCETVRAGVLSPVQNQVEPLVFCLNVSLLEKQPNKGNVMLPVLGQTLQPTKAQIHFQKACGSDNRCHSNLQMQARFTDENQNPFPEKLGQQVMLYHANMKRLLLQVNVSNVPSEGRPAEEAHHTFLRISIPPSLIYSGVQIQEDIFECSVEASVLICELGNPFRSNQKAEILIKFQPSEIILNSREIHSQLTLTTLSEQSDLSPVFISMLVEYSLQTSFVLKNSPGPTFFSGHVIGESAIKKMEDIGSLLLFTFQVNLHGNSPGHLGNLSVEFDWPMETTNGKWLLYLTQIQLNGTSESVCSPPGNIINPLKLQEEKGKRRTPEEEDKKTQPVLHLQGLTKKSYTLDCLHGATCRHFACPLVGMNNSVTLWVWSRLWNSTMIEEFRDARTVVVRGQATLKLHTDKPTVHMESQSTEVVVHIYPEFGLNLDSGLLVRIILVSVLAGALLLALICLLLRKCGFFKRASTRELYQAKMLKAHVKSQPSESEQLSEEH
ncbi:Integrin alpha-3 [Oryzias melastigma]|uniref:Integrin alpha-3 n=2 Tax=Oryzias melastigma TaxID=30732 RepID=A0A834KXN5_ORYME|nr:Integrin alpha-3 [Oryzias melastigma]